MLYLSLWNRMVAVEMHRCRNLKAESTGQANLDVRGQGKAIKITSRFLP